MLGTKMKSEGRVSAEFMQRAVQEAETRRRELAEATSALADYRPQRELVETLRVAEERWLEVPEVLRLAVTKAT